MFYALQCSQTLRKIDRLKTRGNIYGAVGCWDAQSHRPIQKGIDGGSDCISSNAGKTVEEVNLEEGLKG